MEDPVFGTLAHVVADLWQRSVQVRFLGKQMTVPLYVDISRTRGEPEPNQISAFRAFEANQDEMMKAAEQAIIKYRTSRTGGSRSTKRDISNAVRLQAISFPYARRSPTFGVLCECDWEPEHGLAVRFEDDRAVEVGLQDIVL